MRVFSNEPKIKKDGYELCNRISKAKSDFYEKNGYYPDSIELTRNELACLKAYHSGSILFCDSLLKQIPDTYMQMQIIIKE